MNSLDDTGAVFEGRAPACAFWSLRVVHERFEHLRVRQNIPQPLHTETLRGAMITVADRGGIGYAATSDLTAAGLERAGREALAWAHAAAAAGLVHESELPAPGAVSGEYQTPIQEPWDRRPLGEKLDLLRGASACLQQDPRIVDWAAWLTGRSSDTLLLNSAGARIRQTLHYVSPGLMAVANEGTQTQRRTGGGAGTARQGGLEQLPALGFPDDAERVGDQALALLQAPECPTGTMDLLLMPSQMVLQIHESIGHPLELDRILGDERNYAGTSFVTTDMFGSYRYGSDLLNVTFDPNPAHALASYRYDDDGMKAERRFIIRDGILQRPLGGALSQARAATPGVANVRSSGWNRPPIDRMANLNVEPGNATLEQLVGSIEHGVLMDTNLSWSIDDSRNKFQFGCEWGRIIENGTLKGIVRNPNYRGISATFWRSLSNVGDDDTYQTLGVENCGKGEPNQMLHTGHGAPACVFRNVDVFGGGC